MENKTRNIRVVDTAAVVLALIFCSLSLFGLMRDDTVGVVSHAVTAIHADIQTTGGQMLANARITRDLSEYWRPWGANVAQVEEMTAYVYLAALGAILLFRTVRIRIRPALSASPSN